jgi:hypothetical protein
MIERLRTDGADVGAPVNPGRYQSTFDRGGASRGRDRSDRYLNRHDRAADGHARPDSGAGRDGGERR